MILEHILSLANTRHGRLTQSGQDWRWWDVARFHDAVTKEPYAPFDALAVGAPVFK
jgi:hypothetical protein